MSKIVPPTGVTGPTIARHYEQRDCMPVGSIRTPDSDAKFFATVDKKKTCLLAAQAAVCGDRPLNYGSPENNFGRIAILWNAWNAARRPGPYVGADVAIMMDLVKSARLANNPAHSDSWIDKAGYAACGYDIAAKDDK
jgi:Domain of unknown function (DUF6378)